MRQPIPVFFEEKSNQLARKDCGERSNRICLR
jgi:hypothetical protein